MLQIFRFFSIFICCHLISPLSAQWQETFTDGNFTENPKWVGDTSDFIVNPDQVLQLNADGAGTSKLAMPLAITDSLEWQFDLKLDFAPSLSNRVRIYLCADNPDLLAAMSWYLEIGENGNSDPIRLFFRDETGQVLSLGASSSGVAASEPVSLQIKARRSGGIWQIGYAVPGQNFIYFQVPDLQAFPFSGTWFGWECLYSSTRKDKFYLDNISFSIFNQDQKAPQFERLGVITPGELYLIFNEALDSLTATNPSHYQISGSKVMAVEWGRIRPDSLVLLIDPPLTANEVYTLSIEGILDLNNNPLNFFEFEFFADLPQSIQEYQILISEIMADPSPSVGLPEYEWLELFNAGTSVVDLKNLTIEDAGGEPVELPEYRLDPGTYIQITSEGQASNSALEVSDLPSLNNDSDILVIRRKDDGQEIDRVEYFAEWHTESSKSGGGWSLERKLLLQPCLGREAWVSCPELPGGTPGKINASHDGSLDIHPPFLVKVFPLSADTLRLDFSEKIIHFLPEGLKINPDAGQIDTFYLQGASIVAILKNGLDSGRIYTVQGDTMWTDCAGNHLKNITITTGLPAKPRAGDILINEILFNPVVGSVRYIEFFNTTDQVFDCGSMYVVDFSRSTPPLQMPDQQLFFPKQYLVCTPDTADINNRYNHFNIASALQMPLPAWDEKTGNAAIYWSNGADFVILDSFTYSKELHHVFLSSDNKEGASLERLSIQSPANNPSNWTTAASEIMGKLPGSPTQANRQAIISQNSPQDSLLWVEVPRFSPDGDGYEDLLVLFYRLPEVGFTANAWICDANGSVIRRLFQKAIVSPQGQWHWDGATDGGILAPPGIYIFQVEFFHPSGKIKKKKIAFALLIKM